MCSVSADVPEQEDKRNTRQDRLHSAGRESERQDRSRRRRKGTNALTISLNSSNNQGGSGLSA